MNTMIRLIMVTADLLIWIEQELLQINKGTDVKI